MCIRSYSVTFQLAEVRDAAGHANVSSGVCVSAGRR
jgi:hypothetical protein